MKVARHNKAAPHRAPEWRIRRWMKYYGWAEGIIEQWAEDTDDEAVVEFKHRRGYSLRRIISVWLPSDQADHILGGVG